MWQDLLLHCVVFTKTSEEFAPHYLAEIRHDMRQTTGALWRQHAEMCGGLSILNEHFVSTPLVEEYIPLVSPKSR